MKRVLYLISLTFLLLMSCGKEEDPYVETEDGRTRYTVIGNVPEVAASMIDHVTVYEYNKLDERIDSNFISDPSAGTKYVFFPEEDANHLKVKLYSKEDTYRWGDTIVLLREGMNVTITISITSPTTKFEPMLNP